MSTTIWFSPAASTAGLFPTEIAVLDEGVGVRQQFQPLADLVLVHQGQGPDARGVGLGEPVLFRGRLAAHLVGRRGVALVVAQHQVVQGGDADIAAVLLKVGGLRQAAVPVGGLVELALVQHDPGDVIEALQPLAVVALLGRAAEGPQGGEVGRAGAALDGLGQFDRRAFRTGGLGLGAQGDALDQQRDQGEEGEGADSGTGHAASDFAAPCQGLVE